MRKRYVEVAVLCLSFIFLLTACSARDKGDAVEPAVTEPLYEWGNITGKTITVWGDRDDLARLYITRAFERYQEQTGNTIVTRPLSKQDLNVLVPKTFASETAEKPDILLSYGGTNVGALNPEGNFYDFIDAPWIDDLSDVALNQAVYNGKIIGLPHGESSVSGTLYNKKIFKKLGLEIPKTQEEFLQTCETLLENGITPMYLPYAEITMLLYQFPMDSILADKTILSGLNDGTISYADIPEMQKIVEWYKTMSDKGYFGENYLENDWSGMDGALKNGEYAMMLCWDTWLHTDFTGEQEDFGLMPAFMGTPDEGCFEGANVILCLANKNSENLDAALDLITFMADPCNYNIHYEGLYTAPFFNQQTGSITTPQYMEAEQLIDKLFYHSTAWSRVKGFSQIDAMYIQDYMQGKGSIEDCLEAMENARLNRAGTPPQG